MKNICQLYMPSVFRSYGNEALEKVAGILPALKSAGFEGVYLIALWLDGGYDNGFDVVEYVVNPKFGTDEELEKLVQKAHELDIEVGVDVVPNHVSDRNVLAENCLNDIAGYEDALYVASEEEAKRLTDAGVPSFFGKHAYSLVDGKYVRSTFADYYQLNVNWENQKVKEYFANVFQKLKDMGIDFVRVDCGELLLEDVSKADPTNPLACLNIEASVKALYEVAGGMKLFYECFFPQTAQLLEDLPGAYALDCSYVLTAQQPTEWPNHLKLVPLVGGHDQKTVADRGLDANELLKKMEPFEYGFLDIPTLISWRTYPGHLQGDEEYDAAMDNPNQRFRARRPIGPILDKFLQK